MPFAPRLLYCLWTVLVVGGGAVLMSLHQPFQPPTDGIVTLAGNAHPGHWRAVHFLSPSCACSQRVLTHLAARGPLRDLAEDVIVVTGPEPELPEAAANLARAASRGFAVRRLDASAIPADAHLHGVPLLLAVAPDNRIAYRGGYGEHSDQDIIVLQQARAGLTPTALPLLGCAVGQHLRDRVDPLRLKYAALRPALALPRTNP